MRNKNGSCRHGHTPPDPGRGQAVPAPPAGASGRARRPHRHRRARAAPPGKAAPRRQRPAPRRQRRAPRPQGGAGRATRPAAARLLIFATLTASHPTRTTRTAPPACAAWRQHRGSRRPRAGGCACRRAARRAQSRPRRARQRGPAPRRAT
ncbi:MAG: hypothetical protein J3K34DRAFT_405467 [Monoraphidium minutum]|nr:MAG: hypothetical protein J3K34DRAFT_405467 [Monoraphidium minutum]